MGYQKWLCSWWDTESYAACCCTGDTQLGSVCYTSIKYAQFSLQICCILKTIFDKAAVPVCKFFFCNIIISNNTDASIMQKTCIHDVLLYVGYLLFCGMTYC